MDPYLLTIKYIFSKNQRENNDTSIDEFFRNGTSFPQFVALILGLEKVPGVPNPTTVFKKNDNNCAALNCLCEKEKFFKSFNIDFNSKRDQNSLLQLIMNKLYFKTNRTSFLKKCNDFLKSNGMLISNFSEFSTGGGFAKLLNSASGGTISPEMNISDTEQIINQLKSYCNSLNIPVIIDKTSFSQENQDLLMYQAIIIIDSKTDSVSKPMNKNIDLPTKEINSPKPTPKFVNANESPAKIVDKNEKQIQLAELSTLDSTNSEFASSGMTDLPKSSYLNIMNHFLEPKQIEPIKYFSDINDGTILPYFVESLLKEKVPNIITNPTGNSILSNNMNCLYFIKSKYPSFLPENYILRNEDCQKRIIRFLMMKCIFTTDYINSMKTECNSILHQFGIQITNFNKDWDNGKNFVALLNFASKGAVKFPPMKPLDIDELKLNFSQASLQYIIEKDSLFGKPDEFAILYQVRLILQSIGKLSEKEEPKSLSIKQKQDDKQSFQNFEYIYEPNSNPILRLINVIGSEIGLHYNSMNDIINGQTLPLLIKHLMHVEDIPETKPENNFSDKNIESVMNFLKKNNTTFLHSSFDFKKIESITLFSTTLLKQFFLKKNETQMMESVSNFVGKKVLVKDLKQFFLYGKGFCQILGEKKNISDNIKKYDEKIVLETFQKENIPFILDENSLTNIKTDYILFQLQLILNREQKKAKIANLVNSIQNSKNNEKYEIQKLSIKKQKQIDQLIFNKKEEIPKEFLQVPNFLKNVNSNNEPKNQKYKLNRANSIENVHMKSDSLFIVSNDVVFNQDSYNKFRSLNQIANNDSIYIVFIAGLNEKKVPDLIKVINGNSIKIDNNNSGQLEAHLHYCGKIEQILSHYNLKGITLNSQAKNHLACISITGPSDDKIEDFLYFEAAIASQCDLIIIPECTRMNEKLHNILILNEKSISTTTTKKSSSSSEYFLLLFDEYYEKTKSCTLDFNSLPSCSKFVSQMISMFTSSAKVFDNYFKNINEEAPSRLFVNIFQSIEKPNSLNKKEGSNEYKISVSDKYEAIVSFIDTLSRYKLPLSLKSINDFFTKYQLIFADNMSMIDILKNLRNNILKQFSSYAAGLVQTSNIDKIKPSELCNEMEEYLNNEITFINDNSFEIMKDSVKEKINDFIFNEIKKVFPSDKLSKDLIMPIYKIKLENYEGLVNDCMKYLDQIFNSTKIVENENVEIDQNKVKQDSMRYVLAVKESIKELTVEVISENNLEKEMQQDF